MKQRPAAVRDQKVHDLAKQIKAERKAALAAILKRAGLKD